MPQPAELKDQTTLPLLPLRDVVVFPHMVIPLFVGRAKSIKALELAMDEDKQILLVAQRSAEKDEPAVDDLHDIGAVASILQMLKLPDGTVKVLVEGRQRARVSKVDDHGDYFAAVVDPLAPDADDTREVEALRRALLAQLLQINAFQSKQI